MNKEDLLEYLEKKMKIEWELVGEDYDAYVAADGAADGAKAIFHLSRKECHQYAWHLLDVVATDIKARWDDGEEVSD